MPIAASAQVVEEGPRNLIIQFTGICDNIEGGQETNVVKVDVTQLNPACDFVRIERINYEMAAATRWRWRGNRMTRRPFSTDPKQGSTGLLQIAAQQPKGTRRHWQPAALDHRLRGGLHLFTADRDEEEGRQPEQVRVTLAV
jgi:hypothetical protein